MAVTLNSSGITFSDGNSQNSAASGGVSFGGTQNTGNLIIAITRDNHPQGGNNTGVQVPSNAVVVGADTSVRSGVFGPNNRQFGARTAYMRFRYKTLS